MLKKGDIFLIAVILFFVFTGIILPKVFKEKANVHIVAIIKQGDKVIKEIDLDKIKEPQRMEIHGEYSLVISVEKGRIRFEEADCPDKLCVKTGWISKPGDTSVCLPGRTIIKIKGKKAEVDGVTY